MTFDHMQSRTANQLGISLNKSFRLYVRASYNVEALLMDMCFDPVAVEISHVIVNTAAARDHVGEIKIRIRV